MRGCIRAAGISPRCAARPSAARPRRAAAVFAVAALAALSACGGPGDTATSPTTEAPTTTTTTAPVTSTTLAREKEVEVAYLGSWTARAKARRTLDASGLSEFFAKKALKDITDDLEQRKLEGKYSFVRVDHNYTITLNSVDTATVQDWITNHTVLIDPSTGQPLEPDPKTAHEVRTTMELLEGKWKVTFIASRQL